MTLRKQVGAVWLALLAAAVTPGSAAACGAYFGKRAPVETAAASATTRLYNQSTRMIVARDGNVSTITMTADYRGDPKEFAVVIAVPTVLARDQIRTADAASIDALDQMSAPKLTESFDASPCPARNETGSHAKGIGQPLVGAPRAQKAAIDPGGLGVKVEAQYVVGEYDVAVLSASQSDGLRQWLDNAGYQVPAAAEPVLATYIAEGLKFFVAKVNLSRQQEKAYGSLSPLQISYASPKFYVPLRLSTINAEGPQEMFVFALTRDGAVAAANFPTRRMATGEALPVFVKKEFDAFYRAAFERAAGAVAGGAAFVEAVGNVSPRAVGGWSMTPEKLQALGVNWIGKPARGPATGTVTLTRLHMRYDSSFKHDLLLKIGERALPFTTRFSIRHAYAGEMNCPQKSEYEARLALRREREAGNLARLTGWSPATIAEKEKAAR